VRINPENYNSGFFESHLGHFLIRSECFVKIVPHPLHFSKVMPVTIQQNSMGCIYQFLLKY
jgi:hypothetical protein